MQTFLPFRSYKDSAALLDKKRCWKQVVEAHQLLNVITGKSTGWKNHPAAKMWWGFPDALGSYYNCFYHYCVNTHKVKAVKLQPIDYIPSNIQYPSWLGDDTFHRSHINNLARKAIEDLGKGRVELYNKMLVAGLKPEEQDIHGEYVWPT